MLKTIFTFLRFIPLTITLSIFFLMAFLFIRENQGHVAEKLNTFIKQNLKLTLYISYTVLMLICTVLARPFVNPFTNVLGFIVYDGLGRVSLIGILNVLMFVPYVILYNLTFSPDESVKKSFLLSVSTTILIEFCQLIFCSGQFSLSDIIHNTVGGMIGCGIWHMLKIFSPK